MDKDVQVVGNGQIETGKPNLTGMLASTLKNVSFGFSLLCFFGGGSRDGSITVGLNGLFNPASLKHERLDVWDRAMVKLQ